MAFEILKQLARGFFAAIGDNKLTIVSTMRDPAKLRLAVDQNNVETNLGALTFNTRRSDWSETQDEHAYVMGQLHSPGYGALYGATRGPDKSPARSGSS